MTTSVSIHIVIPIMNNAKNLVIDVQRNASGYIELSIDFEGTATPNLILPVTDQTYEELTEALSSIGGII